MKFSTTVPELSYSPLNVPFFQINPDDNHPKQLCSSCYNKCLSWKKFRSQAIETDRKLRTLSSQRRVEAELPIELEMELFVGEIKAEEFDLDPDFSAIAIQPQSECEYVVIKEESSIVQPESDILHKEAEYPIEYVMVDKMSDTPEEPVEDEGATLVRKTKEQKHNSPDNKIMNCPHCSQSFNELAKYVRHLLVHKEIPKTVAPPKIVQWEDPKPLKRSNSVLKINSISEKATPPKRKKKPSRKLYETAKCDYCDGMFSNKYNLSKHVRAIHMGERPYKCSDCDHAFAQKDNLISHQATHLSERSFSCNQCEKNYITKQDLKMHILSHTGEKRFKCDQCDASYLSQSAWRRHNRIHTGELVSYLCDECGKSMKSKTGLARHKMIHSFGEKTLQVPLLRKGFQ